MPKIYEYLGYLFLFYSNEHEPRHCHVQKGEKEMKVEIAYSDQGSVLISFKKIKAAPAFDRSEQNEIRNFVEQKHEDIVKKWDRFFLRGKKPKFEKINRRLKKPGS